MAAVAPPLSPDDAQITLEGWIEHKVNRKWHRRYFVLSNGILQGYLDRGHTDPVVQYGLSGAYASMEYSGRANCLQVLIPSDPAEVRKAVAVASLTSSSAVPDAISARAHTKVMLAAKTGREILGWMECLEFETLRLAARPMAGMPDWVPDKETSNCSACGKKFTMLKRKHHCRRCGHIFCSACSGKFVPLPEMGQNNPVRTCLSCWQSALWDINTLMSPEEIAENNLVQCDHCQERCKALFCYECDNNLCLLCSAEIHHGKRTLRHRKRVLSAKAEVVHLQGSEDAGPEPPGGPPPPAPLSAPTPDEEDDDDDDDNDDTGNSGSGVYDVTGTRSSSSSVETDQKVEVADTPLTRKQQLDLWLQQLCDEGLDVLKVPVSRWGKVRQTRVFLRRAAASSDEQVEQSTTHASEVWHSPQAGLEEQIVDKHETSAPAAGASAGPSSSSSAAPGAAFEFGWDSQHNKRGQGRRWLSLKDAQVMAGQLTPSFLRHATKLAKSEACSLSIVTSARTFDVVCLAVEDFEQLHAVLCELLSPPTVARRRNTALARQRVRERRNTKLSAT